MYEYTVTIFMSTYNGEKYIRQQIDSILEQKDVKCYIVVRDDGSSDNTVKILEEYDALYDNFCFYVGENVGFERSFCEVTRTRNDTDYYAYADQDDYWDCKKMIAAISALKKFDNEYSVYGSNLIVTDEKLDNRHYLYNERQNRILINSLARGSILATNPYACTMVWNKKMQSKLCEYMPKEKVSHDVYLYFLAENIGNIVWDSESYILHRLHGGNTAGIENDILKKVKKGIDKYMKSGHRNLNAVANEIIQNYRDDIKTDRKVIFYLGSYRENTFYKLKLIFSKELMYKSFIRRWWTRILILTNCY